MRRPGLYVNGRRYSLDHMAQAVARADFLAAEFGREMAVLHQSHDHVLTVPHIAKPTASTTSLVVS